MPSLKTFRVEFDRPTATYLSGEIVSGNIIVDVIREKEIRGESFWILSIFNYELNVRLEYLMETINIDCEIFGWASK